jgi:hypothetical protein
LAAWHTAIRRRGEKDSVLEAKPGVEWVALDPEGKVYGPKAVAELQVGQAAAALWYALYSLLIGLTIVAPEVHVSFVADSSCSSVTVRVCPVGFVGNR